jgi:hypothetical protein
VKQKEFGVKGPEVTITGQGTWYIDRCDRKSAVAAGCAFAFSVVLGTFMLIAHGVHF